MKDISEIISKLTGIQDPRENKIIVMQTLKEVCAIETKPKDIDFSGEILKLKLSSPEKNAVFMSQQKILAILQEKIKDRKITRIG